METFLPGLCVVVLTFVIIFMIPGPPKQGQ